MIRKINCFLEKVVGTLIGLLLLGITMLLCVNVITRYGFGFSLHWGEELATYSIIWITFLGSGLCARKGLHVSVDAFVQLLPPGGRWFMKLVANLVGLALSVFLLVVGWQLTMKIAASGQLSPAMMMPMQFAYTSLIAGAAFMILEYIEIVWELVNNRKKFANETDLDQIIGGSI